MKHTALKAASPASAVVPPAAEAEVPYENAEPSEPLVIIENDASIEGPSKPLCWAPQPISEGMARCDRAKGHKGKHSWEKEAVVSEDLRAENKRLREAIEWALGERDDFAEEPPPLAGKYRQRFWWRTELRQRAFGESALAARAPQVYCEACEAGYRLNDHVHYDDARDGATWGVCRKYVAECRAARAPQREGGQ